MTLRSRNAGSLFSLLSLLALVVKGNAAPPMALQTSQYAQRMADRYTTAQGLPGSRVSRLLVKGDAVFAETDKGQAVLEKGRWRTLEAKEKIAFPALAIDPAKLPQGAKIIDSAQAPDKRLWIVTDQGVFRSQGAKYLPVSKPTRYLTQQRPVNVDAVITCVEADAHGQIWFGSNAGIYSTDGKNFWNPIDGKTGLPYEDITCLKLGRNGAIWAGTSQGVCRYTPQGEWQYYWGKRWLPDNYVNAIVDAPDGSAWVATNGGVAHLYDTQITLAQKAAHYERITARHNRRGYVTGSPLKVPGDPSKGVIYEASDNDGLWTSLYVGAEAFRYAVTKDPEAKTLAQKSMRAMLDLVKYSGYAGYPARTLVTKDEVAKGETVGYDPNETVRINFEPDKIWYASPVDPNLIIKGDTSSDEMDGHYFAWYLYHELVADAAEKREIAAVVRAVTDHILNHELTLVGHTGRKTRWGVWNPKYMNEDPMWWEERGLNSLEILSFLKVAEHICGDKRYGEKYRELIQKNHYLLNTVFQKVAEPWHLVNHSDDEMAFMVYYILLDTEKDPATRRVLLQSLERSWLIERPEHSPFFNFVYGALSGRPCDTEAAVAVLQQWPWDLIEWQVKATHRSDVTVLRTERLGRASAQLTEAISPAERRLMRWNGNPYEADGGSPDGSSEEDAGVWLLPYWMGRYHGFILEK